MALIPCPECATEVSDSAPACPKCGFAVASEMEKRQAARLAEQRRVQAEALEARARKRKSSDQKVMAVVFGVLLVGCCFSAMCNSCEQASKDREAEEAKAALAKKQAAEKAALKKSLETKFAEAADDIEQKVVELEKAVDSQNEETARELDSQIGVSLAEFSAFKTSVPPKLGELRSRRKKAAVWIRVQDAKIKMGEAEYADALKILEQAKTTNPSIADLDALFDQVHEGVADSLYQEVEKHSGANGWVKAEEKLIAAKAALKNVPEERRSKAGKRLLRQLERREKRIVKKAKEIRKKKAERADYAKLCGDPPTPDGWDAGLYMIESYVERSAHDPSSIDVENCTQPVLTAEKCWRVRCEVLGKNAFGAQVRNVGTFWIASGQVVGADL